ncbi:GNAT family N-acetyltransferase [Shimia biformata]|uniref:GNAT family N-acetyltransferase n=1 Tax=Shimia biformata TaxID=1294299 RepID=UPI0019508D36|nr:GNAT family N-acetyltransferase [Shimia biformata]
MSNIVIRPGDPRDPQATALLQASHALMQSLFSPEDNHFLSIDALCASNIRFFVAEDDGALLGCVALANQGDYGEVKSMFITPEARGTGIADLLMKRLIAEARAQALPAVKLETGDTLFAAHKVYARHGFVQCGPFGEYEDSPASIFMTRVV